MRRKRWKLVGEFKAKVALAAQRGGKTLLDTRDGGEFYLTRR